MRLELFYDLYLGVGTCPADVAEFQKFFLEVGERFSFTADHAETFLLPNMQGNVALAGRQSAETLRPV